MIVCKSDPDFEIQPSVVTQSSVFDKEHDNNGKNFNLIENGSSISEHIQNIFSKYSGISQNCTTYLQYYSTCASYGPTQYTVTK